MINSKSEINAMISTYATKLGLKVQKTNIRAQKIDCLTFNIFRMVLADIQEENKLSKAQFFQEIFLVINTTLEMIFGILFLTLSNINIQFI